MEVEPSVAHRVQRAHGALPWPTLYLILEAASYALDDAQTFDWLVAKKDVSDAQLSELRNTVKEILRPPGLTLSDN